jgi:hypothetical protein
MSWLSSTPRHWRDQVLQLALLLSICLAAATPVVNAAAADASKPAVACDMMAAHGLAGRGDSGAAGGGSFRCDSRRRSLPLGAEPAHEIRYFAIGSAGRVESLNLQLTINSREEVQAAHRRLLDYTVHLAREALDAVVPDEMAAAILSANNGRFEIGGTQATVRKAQIRSRLYEVIVSITVVD